MEILKADFKKGFATVKINVNDDLWYLRDIIEPGDLVKAKTLRSLFLLREGKREKVGRKPMVLKIQVEKVEFKKHSNRLRLTGKIIEGPEDVQLGSYHTIEVGVDSVLTIYKGEWKKYHRRKMEKAQTKVPDLLIVVTDMNQATFGILRKTGIEIVSELRNPHSIQEEDKLLEFYKKVASETNKHSREMKKIILAGPGFAKEHVQKIIEKRFSDIKDKLIVDSTSSATRAGINEILKRGTLDRIIKESEIIKESQIIQKFFTHLQKDDGLAVYGLEQIKEADDVGAVKTLIVSEEKIREDEIDQLANRVEKKKGQVEIVSRTHELGEQFHRMGGLGAILRFRIY
jgi:protein pelota